MKVITCIPNKEDATSLYRGHGVMCELHKVSNIDCVFPETIYNVNEKQIGLSYLTAKGGDVFFLQRPDQDSHIAALQLAKSLNMPIVIDFDDNLLKVEWHNPYHQINSLNNVNYKKNVERSLNIADAVIVSTKAMKKDFLKHNKNIYVVNNAFDNYVNTLATNYNIDSNVVLWRGSRTHERDFNLLKNEYETIIKDNPDFVFVFWTTKGWGCFEELESKYKNVKMKEAVHTFEYNLHLKNLKPALTTVSLEDTEFNRAKSNIAKLETVANGSLCISNNFDEWGWNSDDLCLYKTPQEFLEKTTTLLKMIRNKDKKLNDMWKTDIDFLQNNYLLSDLNKKRAYILHEVTNSKSF